MHFAFSLIVNNQFILGTLHHGQHKLHRYGLDVTHLGEIELPVPGTIFDLAAGATTPNCSSSSNHSPTRPHPALICH
ncbi:MAG: hypothetical protein R3D55_25120 [Chloroflexota bacterium]